MKPISLYFLASAFLSLNAYADCDAELIAAFRSNYSEEQETIDSRTLYSKFCGSKRVDNRFSLQLPIKGIPFSAGLSSDSAAKACITENLEFFELNKVKIVASLIDPSIGAQLIDACFDSDGVALAASENSDGTIVLEASYDPLLINEPARVDALEISPPNAVVNFRPSSLKRGARLNTVATSTILQRAENYRGDITFLLRTKDGKGSAFVSAPGSIETRWAHYLYNGDPDHSNWQCQAYIDDISNKFDISNQLNCGNELLGLPTNCENPIREGYCKARFGMGLSINPISGEPSLIRPIWETKLIAPQPGNPESWQCIKDGKFVGESSYSTPNTTPQLRYSICAYEYSDVAVGVLNSQQ